MPITELALLTLHPPPPTDDSPTQIPPSNLNALKTAAQAQATFSKHPVTLIQCIDDPSLIYLLGGWDSVAAHMDTWIPGAENKELIGMLGREGVGVRELIHVTADPARVVGLMRGSRDVIGIWRAGFKELGDEVWRARVGQVIGTKTDDGDGDVNADGSKGGVDEGQLAVGWRMDDWFAPSTYSDVSVWNTGGVGRDANEVVVFSVWSSVEKGMRFMEGDAWLGRHARIQDSVKTTEGSCGRVLCVLQP